nr:DUF6023 family protein [uncultured Actinoplanes sp.]
MGEAARGAILYGCAAVLLAGGVTWWVGAAPADVSDKRVEQWRATAQTLLPDADGMLEADTVTLGAGMDQEVVANPGSGEFMVSVVCVGEERTRARVSLGALGSDSGHGLRCSGERDPDYFTVSIVHDLRMTVSVSDTGPVVFRYVIMRRMS